jgi:integrase
MIIAALDTGMRQGEMLAMRFSDIDFERQLIVLRAETTKSRKRRLFRSARCVSKQYSIGCISTRRAKRREATTLSSATRPVNPSAVSEQLGLRQS